MFRIERYLVEWKWCEQKEQQKITIDEDYNSSKKHSKIACINEQNMTNLKRKR